jgi:hypothetical protein
VSTAGAVIIVASVLVFLWNTLRSRRAAPAPANPWEAPGLEWAIPSPPPSYAFLRIPVVDSRTPLWTSGGALPVVSGLHTDRREVLVTSAFDAKPLYRHKSPSDTIGPLLMAIAMAVVFIGSIFSPWAVLGGFGIAYIAGMVWAWPEKSEITVERVETPHGIVVQEHA